MRKLILYLITIFPFILLAENTPWIAQPVSGSVTVYFPSQPGQKDTIGQSMFFLLEGNDMMLATVAPIPNTILLQEDYNQDTVLNNFVLSVIQNANQLIYSNVEYKGVPAKFYKVRVEDPLNTIQGLITDSYNFIFQDTIYSISYLRYKATDLYDYNKQRTFFDRIEIQKSSIQMDADINEFQPTEVKSIQSTSSNKSTYQFIGIAFLVIALTIGIYIFQARRNKK
ncbi:MAG TPA: hypothetical protein VLZ75_02180 [Chitinophagales bacterium]|nr:hypothetical protein [Chitinophagales bacterium]